ncbi:hypothetical protein ACFQPG_09200 [Sphingomonas sp. GCM10030256]|uniref:hypothetical protein n=1 Tax=Sphingomonas sp. GCM10030256 TaxID=3273427 RepID=UPI003617CF1B
MRDQLFDRDYQAGREALNEGLDQLFGRIADAVRLTFAAIHRVEWSAPWKQDSKQDCAGIA